MTNIILLALASTAYVVWADFWPPTLFVCGWMWGLVYAASAIV